MYHSNGTQYKALKVKWDNSSAWKNICFIESNFKIMTLIGHYNSSKRAVRGLLLPGWPYRNPHKILFHFRCFVLVCCHKHLSYGIQCERTVTSGHCGLPRTIPSTWSIETLGIKEKDYFEIFIVFPFPDLNLRLQ